MSKSLFITGTGTDVGKTYVTGLILKKMKEHGQNCAYFKAAMSGNHRSSDGSLIPGDALSVKTVSGIEQPLEEMCPYIYEAAVSPHLAARVEGNPVDMEVVRSGFYHTCRHYDYVAVEGSGGILCPLRFDEQEIYLPDMIRAFQLPCLIIADAGLGTINSVVLTAEYLQNHDIKAAGIFFNHYDPASSMHQDNQRMCEHLTGLPVLACVQDGDTDLNIDPDVLENLFV